jgi:hypothetical protein
MRAHGSGCVCEDCFGGPARDEACTSYAASSPPTTTAPTRAVPAPEPEPGEVDAEEPHIHELLGLWHAGKIAPAPLMLGRMPDHATEPMRLIAEDIALRLGLLLREGITRALPYARSEAVKAGHVATLRGASYVLGRLHDENVIVCVGEMPKLGKGNGTKLFVPPSWRPADPRAVELAGEDGLEDLVWVPDQPQLVGAGVEPSAELADELVVIDGLHDVEPSSAEHPFSPVTRRTRAAR